MNELQVQVVQEVGSVRWNFEEIKTALAAEMDKYAGLVYDDSAIKTAKGDLASLRKLRKEVEDRRKAVKEKCLEPYGVIEAQAKELTGLIDKPIGLIDKQVKDYEEEQKKKRKEEIIAFMNTTFAGLPEKVAQRLKFKVYDSRWENTTAKKSDWTAAIEQAAAQVEGDLKILADTEEEFKAQIDARYEENLVLSDALAKLNELREQKKRILEAEQRRREEEERRRAEAEARRAAAEEAARQKEAMNAAAQEVAQAVEAKPETVAEVQPAEPVVVEKPVQVMAEVPQAKHEPQTISIVGTPEQYKKVLDYIHFIGADYREV